MGNEVDPRTVMERCTVTSGRRGTSHSRKPDDLSETGQEIRMDKPKQAKLETDRPEAEKTIET